MEADHGAFSTPCGVQAYKEGKPWYGDAVAIDQWLQWLLGQCCV